MRKVNIVMEQKDKVDKRINNIFFTQKGTKISIKIQEQYIDVERAMKKVLSQTNHNLWLAIQEFEFLLNEKSIISRVVEQKKLRQSSSIKIINYSSNIN